MLTDSDHQILRELEESLWIAETRFDRSLMDQVFAEDFHEIGRSGRVHSRQACLDLASEPIDAVLPLPDFRIDSLGPDVALVRYTSHVSYDGVLQKGHRTSIWTRDKGPWRLRFHQGTPVAPSNEIE